MTNYNNSNSSHTAWDKITQTHDLFKKIIAPLKEHLGINFGYMIVFNDGRYYQIIEDLECLKKWVTNVETSHIFCARNVTAYFDEPYNFTIWPEEPTCPAMEIYKEHGMWNGITVSRQHKDYTELYWFTKENAEDGWHKWFIRNKNFLLKFIECFIKHKNAIYTPDCNIKCKLFKFSQSFIYTAAHSEYEERESMPINMAINLLLELNINQTVQVKNKLSQQQIKLLSLICQGYTTKMAAQEMLISTKTAEHYIERLKQKLNIHYKSEMIQFYKNSILIF